MRRPVVAALARDAIRFDAPSSDFVMPPHIRFKIHIRGSEHEDQTSERDGARRRRVGCRVSRLGSIRVSHCNIGDRGLTRDCKRMSLKN